MTSDIFNGIKSCLPPSALNPTWLLKLLQRVRSLAFLNLNAIHLSSCMMALCPFKKKYARLLKKHFPGINIVEGTHVESPEVVRMFIAGVQDMLTQPQKTMADMGRQAIKAAATAEPLNDPEAG